MLPAMTTLDEIAVCLSRKRLALVGMSTDERDFSRAVAKELIARGYDVVPVNPKATVIAGRPCAPTLAAIAGSVGWALVMTPAAASLAVVEDAHAAGVDAIWLHRGAGPGAVSEAAVARARALGMTVVAGQCPLMFLEPRGFVHGVHALFKKIGGSYPRAAP